MKLNEKMQDFVKSLEKINSVRNKKLCCSLVKLAIYKRETMGNVKTDLLHAT